MTRATTTIDLGSELRGFIEGLIASGDYQTQSEAVREGVRLLQEQKAASKLAALRQLIAEGEASGAAELWDVDSFLARMKTKYES